MKEWSFFLEYYIFYDIIFWKEVGEMKKKFLYLFIAIFSLFLFLAACDKNDENTETKEDEIINNDDDKKETEDDSDSSYNSAAVVYNVSNNTSYELIAGDEINPIYELVRKNYTYKSSDEEIFTVDKEGNVKTLKAGIAKLKIYSNSKLYAVIKIKVKAKDEVVYNCTEELYNEFKNKFDAYNMDNDLVFNAKITSSGIFHISQI